MLMKNHLKFQKRVERLTVALDQLNICAKKIREDMEKNSGHNSVYLDWAKSLEVRMDNAWQASIYLSHLLNVEVQKAMKEAMKGKNEKR